MEVFQRLVARQLTIDKLKQMREKAFTSKPAAAIHFKRSVAGPAPFIFQGNFYKGEARPLPGTRTA